jgi:thiol-disulfide isomerase/thioredoxin
MIYKCKLVAVTFLLLFSAIGLAQAQQNRYIDSRLTKIDSFAQGSVTYVKFFKPLYEEGWLDTFTYVFARENGRTTRFCLLAHADSVSYVAKDSQFLSLNLASHSYRRYEIDALSAMRRLVIRLPSTFAEKLNPARELLQDSRTTVDTAFVSWNGEPLWAINHKLQYPSPDDSDYVLRKVSYYVDSSGAIRGDMKLDSLWGSSLIESQWILSYDPSAVGLTKIDSLYRLSSRLALITTPAGKTKRTDRSRSIENGLSIGQLSAYDSSGSLVTLDASSDRVRILTFWYAGCGPCHQLRPYLNDLQKRYEGQVEVIGLNPLDSLHRFRQVLRSQHYNYSNVLAPGFDDSLGIVSYPTTLVLDKTGKIVWHARGMPTNLRPTFESAIVGAIERRD